MELLEVLVHRLINYCNDIVDGKIVACKKHISAVKRFLNDLERSQRDDYPYEFDVEELYKFYEWAKLFKYSKGDKNGEPLKGKSIELEDFQLFIVGNIFGWKHKKTGYRRFKKSYIQLARKQAKSFLLSVIASYETFLSGEKDEVYIAGWGMKQSQLVYSEVLTQLRNCDFLKGKWSDSYHRITHVKSESIIMALSREAKNFDGTNPSFIIIDEYHQHKTNEIVESLESGMVRPNSHLCIITTAGLSLSGPCYIEYQYVSKLLDEHNSVKNENYFALVCELDEGDNPQDERLWGKANPLLITFPEGLDTLRNKLKLALDIPEKMTTFLTKNCNIWVQAKKNGYLPLDKWSKCEDKSLSLESMRGMKCLLGVDLSKTDDLTSVSFLFNKEDIFYVFNHNFMPEDTLEIKRRTSNVDYWLWKEQGYITMTPDAIIDYHYVLKYIKDTVDEYELKIQEVCYDNWNANLFVSELDNDGYTVVEIIQGMKTLYPATKLFREKVLNGKVRHDGNPVLTWSIGNAVTKVDHNLNYMLTKEKSTGKIDPIASLLNAVVRSIVLEQGSQNLNDHILSDDFSF